MSVTKGDLPLLKPEDLLRYLKLKQFPLNPNTGLPQLPPKALLSFAPGTVEQLKKQMSFQHSLPFLGARLDQFSAQWAVLSGLGLGSPAAVARLEELRTCGVTDLVFLGSAGSLTKELKPGQVILCDRAFADEGTSRHYSEQGSIAKDNRDDTPSFFAHSQLIQRLTESFKDQSIEFVKAAAWTTDAPYRETQKKIDQFVSLGARCVDMEASALFAAGAFYGLKVSGVFVISDELSGGQWSPHFRDPRVKSQLVKLGEAILKTECRDPKQSE